MASLAPPPLAPPSAARGVTDSILIADDHPIFRAGLAHLVHAAFPPMAIHQAGTVDEMLRIADRDGAPWLFLVDLLFPGMIPQRTIPMLRQHFPRSAIAVVSMVDDDATIDRVIGYGADAYIAKSVPADRIMAALHALRAGHPIVLKPDSQSVRPVPVPDLTPRQVEVLTMVAARKSNKEIARAMSLSHFTVRNRISSLFRTMGARTRGELAEKARHAGLIG
ncbi:LuxR C-terminal-related transcriptional regulator [Sphingopyxis sp.]|jgi:DNA-binding NarL/FixJ family response regulator|uniref:LuxR C-terminal-related transcriptional regulator n=1 Tax=Sphingopyxis sp. TaxID=1908224 RepID=UPI003F70EE1E